MRWNDCGRSVAATWASSVAPWIEMRHSKLPSAVTESMKPGCGNMTPLVKMTMCSKPSSTALARASRKRLWMVGSPPRKVRCVAPAARACSSASMIGSSGTGRAIFIAVSWPLEQNTQRLLHKWPSWISNRCPEPDVVTTAAARRSSSLMWTAMRSLGS